MPCSEAMRAQAYFDGELDAGAALAVEEHVASCAACAALLADLESTRKLLRERAPYHRADDGLRGRISASLARAGGGGPSPRRSWAARGRFGAGAASGAAAMALAASLAFLMVLPPPSNALEGDVMNAHLRALMSDHLIDVVSSDRHTVKPWFAGHTDVSPPAGDFAKAGYTLVGGRADYVQGHRAAVVVYRHGAHLIDVFAWKAGEERLPGIATRNGDHMVFWKSGDLVLCAVSDTGLDELQGLVRLIKQTSAPAA